MSAVKWNNVIDASDSSLSTYLGPLRLNEIKGPPGIPLEFARLLTAEISLIHPKLNMGEVYVYECFLCLSVILGQTRDVNLWKPDEDTTRPCPLTQIFFMDSLFLGLIARVFQKHLHVLSSLTTSTMAPKATPAPTPSPFDTLWKAYSDNTPNRLKFIDSFLFFLMLSGIVQFVYCILVSSFPYNAFLSG